MAKKRIAQTKRQTPPKTKKNRVAKVKKNHPLTLTDKKAERYSGVLLLKNQPAFLHVKKQFQEHTIVKVYHAFLYGSPKDKQGTISLPIGKSRADFRRRSAEHGASGVLREARTDYRVLARGKDASFVEARPFTGRTHQVRVHFKAIGHPVVCDKLYAPRRPCILGFSRLALHASSLTFVHPRGETVTVETPLPPDFVRAREELER